MTVARNLKRFLVDEHDDGFRLHIEDEAGVTFTVLATHEQVDLIVDSLDDILRPDEWPEAEDDGHDHNGSSS